MGIITNDMDASQTVESLRASDFSADILYQCALKAYWQLASKYGMPVLGGRNRIVFESRAAVFKLPRNDAGLLDNSVEISRFRRSQHPYPLAECRLVHLADMPVVVMRKVDTQISIRTLPKWAGSVDCFQVGVDSRGRFLAYDYA